MRRCAQSTRGGREAKGRHHEPLRTGTEELLALTKADPKSLAAGVIAPTVILVIFALTFGNFVALKLAVVNDDAGAFGAAFRGDGVLPDLAAVGASPTSRRSRRTPARRQELYEQGRVNGILTIPEDFSERLGSGDPAQVLYAFDNYNPDMAKNLRLYLDEGIFAFYQEHMPGMEIEVRREFAVGAQLDWFAIIAVGVFMLAVLMGSMFNILYLLNKERCCTRRCPSTALRRRRFCPRSRRASVVALLAGAVRSGGERAARLAAYGCESGMRPVGDPALFSWCWGSRSYRSRRSSRLRCARFSGAAMLSMVTAVVAWFLSGATTSVKYATGALLDVALALPSSYGLSQIRAARVQRRSERWRPARGG